MQFYSAVFWLCELRWDWVHITDTELFCVILCTEAVRSLTWAVLAVLWIGFCHTGPIPLCIDLFVFICVHFVCFCFILHSCIIVSMVGWTWWYWSLILRTLSSFSALTLLVRSYDRKLPSPIWPIMCLAGCYTLLNISSYLTRGVAVCRYVLW